MRRDGGTFIDCSGFGKIAGRHFTKSIPRGVDPELLQELEAKPELAYEERLGGGQTCKRIFQKIVSRNHRREAHGGLMPKVV